jgi:hypothetical protein
MKKSQASIEKLLLQRNKEVEKGNLSPEKAYSTMDDWIVSVGDRKVFLHPNHQQWMWFDRLNDEWVFAECGVGEGILLTAGNSGGVKKLPQPGKVEEWAVYQTKDEFFGPLLAVDLLKHMDTLESTRGLKIWTPKADRWLSATEFKKIIQTG